MEKYYLDNAATTQIHPTVIKQMCSSLENDFANPSSLYDMGIQTEKKLRAVRETIARTLHAKSDEIIFTSGGSEGDNTIIKGIVEIKRPDVIQKARIITTSIEHPAVKDVFKMYEEHGIDVVWLPVDCNGIIDLDSFRNAMTENTILVSIIGVNNELGSKQDLEAIGRIIKNTNSDCFFHTDYVQGYMKEPLDVNKCQLDGVTICSHKICGPKGVGAIYLRQGQRIKPLILGGGQETGLRSGTENVAGLIGFQTAIELMGSEPDKLYSKIERCKKIICDGLSDLEDVKINSNINCSPYVVSVSFRGLRGEVLLHSLEARGVYVSTGSACSSHKKEKQSVLKAIHLDEQYLEGTIRISFSLLTTEASVQQAVLIISEEATKLRKWMNFNKKR